MTNARGPGSDFEAIFRGAPYAMWIVSRDGRRVLDVNDAALARYGYTRGEFLTLGLTTLDAPARGARRKTDVVGGCASAEARRHRTRTGELVEVLVTEHDVTFRHQPARVATAIDVTAQRRKDDAIRGSEFFLRRSQEVGNLGSYRFDVASGTWASSAKLDDIFGIDDAYPKTVEGWLALIHPRHRDELREHLLVQVLGQRQRFDKEYEIVRASDGERRWVHGRGELDLGEDGEPVEMFGTIQDVTERRRAEESLRHAQKLESVGRLAGGVAHDFNNLLTAMGINTELGMMETSPEHPAHARFVEIAKGIDSATNLTRQLLAFSRKQAIDPRVMSLNDVIHRFEKMLERLLGEDVELVTSLSHDLRAVRIDVSQAEQVLVNLAVNARDAMPRGGRLTLETRNVTLPDPGTGEGDEPCVTRAYVMLSVADTGEGMSENVKSHLFEPFFTTKPQGRGTGLGLATVYGVVNRHQGRIEFSSVLGAGTTFRIYLPAVDALPERLPGPRPVALARGTEAIVLVEDEERVRARARELLERLGYRVYDFADGEETLAALASLPLDLALLVTDVVMPGLDGRRLAAEIERRRPGIQVLYTSGYTDDVLGSFGVLEPGTNFLPKPYRLEALASRVRTVLDGAARHVGA
ncbi:MAG: response regulator [Deltaproteobacteria bacterium]|nr:response regulator [Deltaproteobacteria bacterium]